MKFDWNSSPTVVSAYSTDIRFVDWDRVPEVTRTISKKTDKEPYVFGTEWFRKVDDMEKRTSAFTEGTIVLVGKELPLEEEVLDGSPSKEKSTHTYLTEE